MTEESSAITNSNSDLFFIDRREVMNDIVATNIDANSNSLMNQNGRVNNS